MTPMTATKTDPAAVTQRSTRSTNLPNRSTVVVVTVIGLLAVNLLIYVIGRASGGAFIYRQSGKPTRVDAVAVAIMSVVPLTIGLTLVASLSRRWPALITTAKVLAPTLAVATIGLITLPARFDTASTLFLAAMHLALIPATLLALAAMAQVTARPACGKPRCHS
jgi:Family of unknown function (DUF6069)